MTSSRARQCHARHGLTLLIIAGLAVTGCGDPAPTNKPTNTERNGGAGGSRSGGSGGVVRAGGSGGVVAAGGSGGGEPAAGGAGGVGGDPGQGGAGGSEETDVAPDTQTPPVDMVAPGPECNNGVAEPGEECDLGAMNETNPYGPDKCSKTCKKAPFCGDDLKNGEEECDNGQQNSDTATGKDGCTKSCKVPPYCGDREKDANEACDAGPTGRQPGNGVTGCTPDCKVIPLPSCGDGVTNAGEECDNGPANNNTAIGANACTTECKRPKCGDTHRQADEECDLGPTGRAPRNGLDGCTAGCKLIRCGNGRVDAVGEECDRGGDNTNDDSLYGRRGACNRQCKEIKLFCGDGITTTPPEACDAGPTGKPPAPGVAGCLPNCTIIPPLAQPVCNNGRREGDEVCDTAMNSPHGEWAPARNGCNTMCKRTTQFCGDGTKNGPEACDGGPDGVAPTDLKEGCSKTCTVIPKLARCGDGKTESPEECDQGEMNLKSPNLYGPVGGCTNMCKKIKDFCGDGIINGVETCDDKDKNIDSSYLPSFPAGVSKPCSKTSCTVIPYCGDGLIQTANGETCDDGQMNGSATSNCKADCKLK